MKLKIKINQENNKKIAIKRMMTKLDKKIKWNQMLKNKIEKQNQL
jgi:hypothetical protein